MKDGAVISTFCSMVQRVGNTIRKTFHDKCRYRDKWPAKAMVQNEAKALELLLGQPGCQQLVKVSRMTVVSQYAGHRLRHDDCRYEDALRQGNAIIEVLRRHGITHRDIRPENLVCHNGKITLIDFQWAYFRGCIFKSLTDAPKEMGGRYRHPAIDDRYSMVMSMRRIWGK